MELGANVIGRAKLGTMNTLPIEAPILLNINSPPNRFEFDRNSYPCLSVKVKSREKLFAKSAVLINKAYSSVL